MALSFTDQYLCCEVDQPFRSLPLKKVVSTRGLRFHPPGCGVAVFWVSAYHALICLSMAAARFGSSAVKLVFSPISLSSRNNSTCSLAKVPGLALGCCTTSFHGPSRRASLRVPPLESEPQKSGRGGKALCSNMTGDKSVPSSERFLGFSMPATDRMVGMTSRVMDKASVEVPGLILPGHHTIAGTRVPPS